MCEINPKRKKVYRLEFFTAHEISDAEWFDMVYNRLLLLEQFFNRRGAIRVHIHELEDLQGVRIDVKT